jgi:hypothetical protein
MGFQSLGMDESFHLDENHKWKNKKKPIVGWNIQIVDENIFGWMKLYFKKTLPSLDWC